MIKCQCGLAYIRKQNRILKHRQSSVCFKIILLLFILISGNIICYLYDILHGIESVLPLYSLDYSLIERHYVFQKDPMLISSCDYCGILLFCPIVTNLVALPSHWLLHHTDCCFILDCISHNPLHWSPNCHNHTLHWSHSCLQSHAPLRAITHTLQKTLISSSSLPSSV